MKDEKSFISDGVGYLEDETWVISPDIVIGTHDSEFDGIIDSTELV